MNEEWIQKGEMRMGKERWRGKGKEVEKEEKQRYMQKQRKERNYLKIFFKIK